MQALEVIVPGLQTTVQDLGRIGYQDIGMPVSGALDPIGLRLANALVGNPPGAPALEMLVQGPTLKVASDSVRVALVGGRGGIEVSTCERKPLPAGRSVRLARGAVFRIGTLGDSLCAYLAIEGGADVPAVLGSTSTYVRGALGGFQGRRLQKGDRLALRLAAVEARVELALPRPLEVGLDQPIRVVLGPQVDYFTEEAGKVFLTSEFRVSPQSDRMGFRLDGPMLTHARGYDITSDGIVPGAIQVPGSGRPIVLMVENQTTGGYPKIGAVISADLPLVARRKPGRSIRFVAVDVREAEALRRTQEADMRRDIVALCPVPESDSH